MPGQRADARRTYAHILALADIPLPGGWGHVRERRANMDAVTAIDPYFARYGRRRHRLARLCRSTVEFMVYRGGVDWTSAVDGLRLCYDRAGAGVAAVLLHGWPGDRTEYSAVVDRLPAMDVVVPDLRGFGDSDRHAADPGCYGVGGQARGVIGLIEELGLDRPVVAGHDIGSRIAVAVARMRPDLVRALVLTPPLPGMGERILGPQAAPEFWYVSFNQLPLAVEVLDGRPDAVRAFLRHFWTHWAGPEFILPEGHLDHLVAVYSAPGAAAALLGWYRAGVGALAGVATEHPPPPADRITVPATVLWPGRDPLFPPAWSDRLGQYFTDLRLQHLSGIGHFVPMEAPNEFAQAVAAAGRPRSGAGTGGRLAEET